MDADAIAAQVFALAGVERLVQIPDHVDEEFQCLDALLFRSIRRTEGGFETFESGIDVPGRIFVHRFVLLAVGDIHVMPGVSGFPGGIGTNFVGPVGDFSEAVRTQEVADGLCGFGREVIFRDLADDAMPGLSPGKGQQGQKHEKRDDFPHGAATPR